MTQNKLTEDRTVELLIEHLKTENYTIESFCLGQKRGYDIVAKKNEKKLIIEVKGAKAHKNSPTKRREYFDSGQIKTHFGKAIVKALETKVKFPTSDIAIAHPNDENIKKAIGELISEINKFGIIHYWVNPNGKVIKEI
jgi:hypothetical protein